MLSMSASGDKQRATEHSPRVVDNTDRSMASTMIAVGLGLAAAGFAGRYVMRNSRVMGEVLKKRLDSLPGGPSRMYRGGFETKMTRREAALILGVSPNATKMKVKDAHKRIMIANHPDKGGSPYLASKINEAKDILDSHGKH